MTSILIIKTAALGDVLRTTSILPGLKEPYPGCHVTLEMVDAIASFADDTPAKIIQRVTPNVLVKGEDWAGKGVVGKEWVEAHGGQVVLAPLLPDKSTTGILAKARATSDN